MSEEEELEFFDRYGFFKGRASRGVVTNSGLWHKGVHVWVFNSKGELYLKKRVKRRGLYPEHWEDIGEHLKPGESFEEAARRGLEEELGVKGARLKRVAEAKMCFPEKNCELVELWKCEWDGKIRENKEESFGGRFYSFREIEEMIKEREMITPWFKELFYWYLKEGKEWGKGK